MSGRWPSCKREMQSGEAETRQFNEHHNIRHRKHQSEWVAAVMLREMVMVMGDSNHHHNGR